MNAPEFHLEVGGCSDLRSFWKYQNEGHCCHVALLGIRVTSSYEND